ncbi:MAG: hypothetical protein IJU44_03930 [Kiritimatiellae bacterium]|nr:hypothetical protein [Kiritimatiellia bacterium]
MIRICPALLLLLTLSGCMTVELKSQAPKNDVSAVSKCFFGSYYGFWWGENPQERFDSSLQRGDGTVSTRGISRAVYGTNAGYGLAALLTLGLFAPVDVYWWPEAEPPAAVQAEIPSL